LWFIPYLVFFDKNRKYTDFRSVHWIDLSSIEHRFWFFKITVEFSQGFKIFLNKLRLSNKTIVVKTEQYLL